MDIRNWFTSPKSTSIGSEKLNKSSKTPDKEKKRSSSKNKSKLSKKRQVASDSDDEYVKPSKKKHTSPKSRKNSDSPKKAPAPRKKRQISSDEDIIIDSDSDTPTKKKKNALESLKPGLKINPAGTRSSDTKPKEKTLKAASVLDFFGTAPVERKKTTAKVPQKGIKPNLEQNHKDEDFSKTLQLLEEIQTNDDVKAAKIKNSAETEPSAHSKKKLTRHPSSDIEIEPSPDLTANNFQTSEKMTCIESIHDDDDFQKTLLMIEHEEEKKSPASKQSAKKTEKADVSKKTKSKKLSGIEFEPSPKPVKKEKIVEKKTPSAKEAKKKGNASNYMSYLHRDQPRALGSKEIPEGEEDCLKGMTFIVTGVLECITREETKDLIEKHGGKLMTTLSKNTTHIVIGRDAGPSKLEKAEKLGTKQLNEDELFDLVRNTPGKGPRKEKKVSPQEVSDVDIETATESGDLKDNTAIDSKQNAEESNCVNESIKAVTESSPLLVSSEADKLTKHIPGTEMWVDKYKPNSLKQLIGQQGDKSNAKKLLNWLKNWSRNTKNKKASSSGRWNSNDDGSSFKAALLSGPPGVGKTTTAQLVCKELGFDFFELNASDTRSKKSLQEKVSELLRNQSLAHCFKGGVNATVTSNHAVIMDEVDGMAGNEDRGGIQELIGFIKASKVPIICICNDRNHPKIRSLSNYCFDLRFLRPRVEQIKAAMMSIAFKEGLKVTPNVLQDVIVASNQDIRQVLHNLSVWCAKDKGLTAEQAKKDIGQGTKHIKLGPFDVLRDVFTIGQNSNATINDKASLFFHDYSIAPLFVQENYVHVMPKATGGDKTKHLHLLSECADSICIGDIIEKRIRSEGNWNLLPVEAIFASVIPGELLAGNLKQMVNFPAWLGKNSSRNHMDRILQELQMHMRTRITGNKTEVSLAYLPLLRDALTQPLLEKEAEGVKDVLKVMEQYCLLREDFDNIIELSLWPNQTDPRSKISAKVKSAFTRAYNKECSQSPYATSNISKKKKKNSAKDSELDGLGEEEAAISEDSEDDDKLENDAMIKVKKPAKTSASSKNNAPTTSKKGSKKSTKKGSS